MLGAVKLVGYFSRLRQEIHIEWMIFDVFVVALLIGLGVGVKPGYRAFCEYRLDRTVAAAESAARKGDWVTARDQAHIVLLARQQDLAALRVWTRALCKLGDQRSYLSAVNLFNDPRSTRDDHLEALEVLVAQGPHALALSAYGGLPEAQRDEVAFRIAIAPLLVQRGETDLVETWMRAATPGTNDPKARLALLHALCRQPQAARLAEARRIFAGLIASNADDQALAALVILGDTPGGLAPDPVLPDLPAWLKRLPQASARHHLLATQPALAAQSGEAEHLFGAAIARFLASDPAALGTWLIGHEQAATAARILEIPANTRADVYLVRLHALLQLKQTAELMAALAVPPPGVDLEELEIVQARFADQNGDASAASAAWARAMRQAAFDTTRNRFIDLAARAAQFDAPEAAANAWVAAFRVGWGPLPLYRDLLPVYAALFAQGRSSDLLAVFQVQLRVESRNPELLANFYYLALIHATMPPAQVIAGLAELSGQLERSECQGTLMLAEMMDGRAAAALARLPQLAADKSVSAPMKAALEGTARLLAGETEAGSALLKDIAWSSLMRQERSVFTDLLAKNKLVGIALPELVRSQVVAEPEQAPAWRKAVEQRSKDHAGEVLPALPPLRVPGTRRRVAPLRGS